MSKSASELLTFLEQAEIEMEGLVPWGSNYTFLVSLCWQDEELQAIYKPRQGERPLWDFPTGTLCLRERAAYLVSDCLGWDLVPPTILRQGPRGWGSLQLFVPHDPEETYFTIDQLAHEDTLKQIALLDIIINNADRKGGHIIRDEENALWAIDHGIAFHAEYKLRTVIWEFAGQPIPPDFVGDLQKFYSQLMEKRSSLRLELEQLLSTIEVSAFAQRLEAMLQSERFLNPGPGRHYPWPLV